MKCLHLLLLIFLTLGTVSCRKGATLASAGFATGIQSPAKKSAAKTQTIEEITPEQEHRIGRAVGATILARYPALNNPEATAYINLLGQVLASASDRPQTFAGYHFLILDSDEINAFAAPGGLIFVTRGLVSCCTSEDALAAVLAHEIAHVQLRHGLLAIEKSRHDALCARATEADKTLASSELAALTVAFEGAVGDIMRTLLRAGYLRSQVREADQAAIVLLRRVGYVPGELITVLQIMEKRQAARGAGFAKTHPLPQDRIRDIEAAGVAAVTSPGNHARQERFAQALGSL